MLKSPQHCEQLGPLMATFPDATVAFTHRDPVAVIQSAITMMAYSDRLRRTSIDPAWLLDYWTDRVHRLLSACVRDRNLVAAERSIDISFHQLNGNEMPLLEELYQRGGVELTPKVRERFQQYLDGNPRGKHGRIRYDLQRHFGVSADELRARFGFYFDQVRRPPRMKEISSRCFEPVYRSRPGADAMRPASAEEAEQIAPGLWCSPGLSNAYLLTTGEGRVIVNTGMGFEGPVHRANFDAVDSSPVRYIIFTQGHVDHVGGLDSVRDPDTTVVAQANWTLWRDDNERLIPYRASRSAFAFKDTLATGIQAIQRRLGTTRLPGQSVPTVDLDFEDTLTLELGGRRMELISVPGGETNDSLVVWLPEERICLCGNTFGPIFGHIPNLVTMRGDRYRDALTAIASVERVRDLQPELLVTGHFEPIAGADRIDAELTRLRDAIQYLHDQTVAGMNAGKDVRTLMREITLARGIRSGPRLREGLLGCAGRLGELLGLVSSPVDDRALPGRFRCRQHRRGRTRGRRRARGPGTGAPCRRPSAARHPPCGVGSAKATRARVRYCE